MKDILDLVLRAFMSHNPALYKFISLTIYHLGYYDQLPAIARALAQA